jgi:hypothetical protein
MQALQASKIVSYFLRVSVTWQHLVLSHRDRLPFSQISKQTLLAPDGVPTQAAFAWVGFEGLRIEKREVKPAVFIPNLDSPAEFFSRPGVQDGLGRGAPGCNDRS